MTQHWRKTMTQDRKNWHGGDPHADDDHLAASGGPPLEITRLKPSRRAFIQGVIASSAALGVASAKAAPNAVFRIHPALGIGRVGDSEEFNIAPVTAAGIIALNGLMRSEERRVGKECR